VRQSRGDRVAVFAFAIALVAAIVGTSFAAGYIIGRLIL
jgi:hypothetical protein